MIVECIMDYRVARFFSAIDTPISRNLCTEGGKTLQR